MHQAEQAPLGAQLVLASQREAIQSFVVAQIAEHRLNGGDALAVKPASALAVDGRTHAVNGIVGVVGYPVLHGNLALSSQCAASAVAGLGLELLPSVAEGGMQRTAAAQGAARRPRQKARRQIVPFAQIA